MYYSCFTDEETEEKRSNLLKDTQKVELAFWFQHVFFQDVMCAFCKELL